MYPKKSKNTFACATLPKIKMEKGDSSQTPLFLTAPRPLDVIFGAARQIRSLLYCYLFRSSFILFGLSVSFSVQTTTDICTTTTL